MHTTVQRAADFYRRILASITYNGRFAMTVALILGLGIGINVATLGLLYRYYLSPLPWSNGGRIITVYYTASQPIPQAMSVPTWELLKKNAPALINTGLYRKRGYNLEHNGQTRRIDGVEATASVFSTLGVQPILGRVFGPDSDQTGRKPVAVLSYRLWQSLFSGNPATVGKTLKLNGKLFTVIGVMPKHFNFPTAGTLLWTPRVFLPYEKRPDMMTTLQDQMVGRLASGQSIQQLQAQADAVVEHELASFGPKANSIVSKLHLKIRARGWRASRIANFHQSLTLTQLATALLMALVWFNLANLVLARTFNRRSELAMRRILGADTRTLAVALARENFVMSLLGALLGVVFGHFLLGLFSGSGIAAATSSIPATSWPVLIGIALLLALVSAAIFTAVGIGFLRGNAPASTLGESGNRASPGPLARKIRMTLLASQIALACALAGCGLLLGHSLLNLDAVKLGFKPNRVVTFEFSFPQSQYSPQKIAGSLTAIHSAIRHLPGIDSASLSSNIPFGGQSGDYVTFPRPARQKTHPSAFVTTVGRGYLKTLGIPLLSGRTFVPSDAKKGKGVAIIDSLAAEQLFGTKNDVVGRQFSFSSPHDNRPGILFRVIGLVPIVHQKNIGSKPERGSIYLDSAQAINLRPHWWMNHDWYLSVRSPLPISAIVSEVRKAARRILPGIPLYNVKSMNQRVANALASKRLLSLLVGLFAFGALLLAAIGLYAVQAYAVAQRAREFGIRMALGAEGGQLMALVLGEAARLLVIGLVIGLAGLAAIGVAFASAFYGISPFNPLSMVEVAAVLCLATLAAGWLPAWRASRITPSMALRTR